MIHFSSREKLMHIAICKCKCQEFQSLWLIVDLIVIRKLMPHFVGIKRTKHLVYLLDLSWYVCVLFIHTCTIFSECVWQGQWKTPHFGLNKLSFQLSERSEESIEGSLWSNRRQFLEQSLFEIEVSSTFSFF